MIFTTLTKRFHTTVCKGTIVCFRVLPVLAMLFTASAVFAQAPANDDVCGAIELIPGATCTYVSGTNVGATADESGVIAPPICANFNEGVTREVWYKATVPAGGALTFDMQAGSMTNGGMQVYRGNSCSGTLAPLACDENSSSNANMPRITITGQVVGATIFVRVWSENGTLGTFGICATIPVAAPLNDDPCGAIELTVNPTCTFQQFTNASASNTGTVPAPVCAGYQGGDVWFKVIVPPATTALTFDSQAGVVTDGGMGIYSGSSCTGTMLLLACDDNTGAGNMPRLTVGGFAPGDTVWVRFWENGNNNNGTFGICVTLPPPPPANDDPCTAAELIVDATCTYQNFTTVNATASMPTIPAPTCGEYAGGDVWFRAIVPAGGGIAFDSRTGVITDAAMAVYTGNCGNLALIACDDDASANGNMPRVIVGGLPPGDTVWVRMWDNENNTSGTFGICASIPPPPPANDQPCNAIALTVEATCTYIEYSNQDATGSVGVSDPGCAGYNGGDVWFKVIVPAEGALAFDTDDRTMTDGGMALYSGNACAGTLTLLTCDDNSSVNGDMPSFSVGSLTPGDTVWVRIWSNNNENNGTFGLCVSIPPPPPSNDEPCTAVELIPALTCDYQTFSNENTTGSLGVPDPGCAEYAGGDVWFKVLVPAEGGLIISTAEGAITDGGMALYSGTCGSLSLLDCNDDTNDGMPLLNVGGLTPGDTVYVRFWAYDNEESGTFGICARIPPPPPSNDNPCGAIELTPTTICNYQTFTNENSTDSPGVPEPECANYQGGDVWFKVVVPAEGTLIFNSQDDVITDGGMALYTGTCGNLTLLDCDDDGSANGAMPFLRAEGLTPGDTIYVRFWEYGGDNNGTFGICVRTPAPPPVNDDPCTAAELIVNTDCTYELFTNESAGDAQGVPDPGCADYDGHDIWFKAVVPAGGAVVFDTEDHDMTDGAMAVYRGTCAGLTLLDCNDDGSDNGAMPKITLAGLTPGDTLYVRVWSPFNDNNGSFGICASIPPPPPSNDDPCTATVITPGPDCTFQEFTTLNATNTQGVPAPGCANYLGSDVWFSVVVPANGALEFDANDDGDITDGGMAIYSGTCDNLTLIDCDDDGSDNGAMPFISAGGLTPGDTIWVRFWEYGGDNNGTFSLCVRTPPPGPTNDDPCGAIEITASDVCTYQSFTNESALSTGSVPAPPCGDYEGADVWFKVTAPAAGAININTEPGSMEDAAMAIYTADSCNGTLTLVACDDNGSANPGMPFITATGITPGSTLWIRVWSPGGGTNAGTFGICAVIPPLQPPTFSFACARDTTFTCGGGDACFTLDAVIPNIHSLTDRYAINPLSSVGCFNPYIDPGSEGPSTDLAIDDTYTEEISLPFTFPFFGTNYNSLIASTNGYISFDVTEAGNFSHWDIVEDDIDNVGGTPRNLPSGDDFYDRALVMGPYHDLNPFYTTSPTQRIKYNVTGTAPHRRWVLSFYKVPLYTDFGGDCDELIENTHQIVLYEGTGIVEVFIFDMQNCDDWNQGRAMVGIQDFSRTRGYMAPGRAASDDPWGRIGMNESWRFVPIGGQSLFKRVELFDTLGNFLATGDTSFLDSASLKVHFSNLCALNRLPAGLNTLLIRSTYQSFDDPTREEVGADTITIFVPNLKVNFDVTNGQCNNLGSVSIHKLSGVEPFRFSSDSGLTWQTDSVFTNLAAGRYYIKVQDGAGCARDTIVDIEVITGLPVDYTITNAACSGDNATVIATPGGVWPFTYSSDGGATTQTDSTFTLGGGTYNFHIVDVNGCAGDSVIEIIVPLPITAAYADSTVHCNGGTDGTISVVSVSGGTAPYTYSFDSGTYGADTTLSTFAPGPHTVSIRDANGCTKDTTIIINEPALIFSVYADSAAKCNGSADGIISVVSVSGGTAPFTYSFDSNPYGADTTVSNLTAGTHTISIRDANGCTKDTTITITEPAAMYGVYASNAALCNGSANGIISVVSVSGGAAPYTYSFDSGTYGADTTLSTFAAGPHVVSIRDANGCTKDTTIIITEPAPIVATYTVHNASCSGSGADGSIVINVTSGGTAPFEYSADAGVAYQAADSFPLASGTYTIRIRDAGGCTKDSLIEVLAPPAITATYTINPVKCFAANSGSIVIAAAGGTPGYQYSADGGTNYQADDSFALAAGTYAVRIRDANGCTKDTSIIVTEPQQLQATASAGSTGCNTAAPTGQITVTATGGTPDYTYSSDGTNFQAGNNFTGLTDNNYTITVTDANGCTVTTAAVVGVVNDLTLQTREDTTICTAIAVGLYTTTNAQTITWTGTNLSSTTDVSPTASPTAVGTAEYIVVAQTGSCIARDTVHIIVTAPPTVYAGDGVEISKGQDATIPNATVSNAARFEWSPTTYLNNANTLSPTAVRPQETITYMLTAFNTEGCSSSDTVTVTVLPYCIKVKNAFTPNGDGVNDNWMVYDQFDCLQNVTVQVFNRYGSRVFESKNYRNDWKGTYNGSSLPDATYYYIINFKMIDGKNYQVRGDVTILR